MQLPVYLRTFQDGARRLLHPVFRADIRTWTIENWIRLILVLPLGAAIVWYYFWAARSTGNWFYWEHDLPGYYNLLGRAFAQGQLHLPVEPSPELLALSNPWDPNLNAPYRMHDVVLFDRRYYLYHGAGPALMAFAPWRLWTGHDLPENFALALFCALGFLFSYGTWTRVLALSGLRAPAWLLPFVLLSLGICQSVPYLLNRIWVYEVAIGAGYFCVSAAVYFLTFAIDPRRSGCWGAASGLMFGLAISCRPHLGLAGAIAGLVLVACMVSQRAAAAVLFRRALWFALPLAAVASAVLTYNYVRFGKPLEFGVTYLLAGEADQQRVRLAAENVLPSLYFMLLCPPFLGPVFPWFRLAFRFPFGSAANPFPPGYFIEPTVGALFLSPLITGLLLLPFVRPRAGVLRASVRILLWGTGIAAFAILLFVCATGFTTQRYEVDFLPLAVFTAVAVVSIVVSTAGKVSAPLLGCIVALVTIGSSFANLALGITGPYDDMLQRRPKSYLRVANWFTFSDQLRPVLDPYIAADLIVNVKRRHAGAREPILTVGHQSYRLIIYLEHLDEGIKLTSQSDTSTVSAAISVESGPRTPFLIVYSPDQHRLTVSVNDRPVLSHDVKAVVTAPAQVVVGRNEIDVLATEPTFSGEIQTVRLVFRESHAAAGRR